jgi:hypothetical protein
MGEQQRHYTLVPKREDVAGLNGSIGIGTALTKRLVALSNIRPVLRDTGCAKETTEWWLRFSQFQSCHQDECGKCAKLRVWLLV